MQEPDLFKIFTNRLNQAGITYFVTGAVASMIYGEPRLTHDIDIVVELTEEGTQGLVQVFPSEEFYCPPVEVIRVESKRSLRGHFNLIHQETGFKADVYLMGEDRLHHWAMSRRRQIKLSGQDFWIAPPEYVILRKLEYYREGKSEKHLRDIASMIELSGDEIDLQELLSKITDYSLEREWEKARKQAGLDPPTRGPVDASTR